MTKEELEKEAEEYGKKATAWLEDREPLDQRDIENAYLAGAEPREKQITILSKHILELQKDKGNLIDRCRELEKRCANYEMTISKMEKGTCDICKEIEKDKKIEELENACDETQKLLDRQIEATYRLDKENAELDCQKNRNKFCYSCANATERCFKNEIGCPCEKYKSWKEENAELRKDKKELCHSISEGGKACVYLNEQLTKATEIIKKLYTVFYAPCVTESDLKYRDELFAEIKQFLSEVGK